MLKIKSALQFLRKNWYGAVTTLTLFLIAIKVLGTWAGFGVPFMIAFSAILVFIIKKN